MLDSSTVFWRVDSTCQLLERTFKIKEIRRIVHNLNSAKIWKILHYQTVVFLLYLWMQHRCLPFILLCPPLTQCRLANSFWYIKLILLFFYSIVTGTYNRNTHIFDIPSYQHVKSLTGHIGAVTVVTASSSGRYLFTASSDSTAMVWTHNNGWFVMSHETRMALAWLCYSVN